MRRSRKYPIWSLLALSTVVSVVRGEAPVSFHSLLREMIDLEGLTRFPNPPYRTVQSSSQVGPFTSGDVGQRSQRSNTIDLGQTTEDRPAVLFDAQGPGAIVRMWFLPFESAKGTVEVYVDDMTAAVLKLPLGEAESDGSTVLGPPFLTSTGGAVSLYFPIPYSSRCRVTLNPEDAFGVGRLAYQVTARAYSAGTIIEGHSRESMTLASDELSRVKKSLSSGAETQAIEGWDIRMPIHLSADSPAAEVQVPRRRGGVAAELRLRPSTFDEDALRATILTISFDGRTTVRAPLGDFFGTGPGASPYSSLLSSVTSEGEFVSHWPMPFVERMKIALEGPGGPIVGAERRKRPRPRLPVPLNVFRRRDESRRKKKDPESLVALIEDVWVEGAVMVRQYAWDSRSMYFHANWNTFAGSSHGSAKPWNALALSGQGVFVGTTLNAANPVRDWWGEGRDRVSIDGEESQGIVGTGTADYFGLSAGEKTLVHRAYFGLTRAEGPKSFGHWSYYRWRTVDRVPYQTGLRFDLETLFGSEATGVSLDAVNYWYADPSHSLDVARIPEPAARVPSLPERDVPRIAGAIEGESLVPVSVDGEQPNEESMADHEDSGPWSGDAHLSWRGGKPGNTLTLGFDAPAAGRYSIQAYFSKSADSGIHRILINEESTGDSIDLFARRPTRVGPIELGTFPLQATGNRLGVEVLSSSRLASPKNCTFGLDCLVLTPVR